MGFMEFVIRRFRQPKQETTNRRKSLLWHAFSETHWLFLILDKDQDHEVENIFIAAAAAAAAALFQDMRLVKAANWKIGEVIHLLSSNLVLRGSLTFWIDSKGYCCCSCTFAAAAAAILLGMKLEEYFVYYH